MKIHQCKTCSNSLSFSDKLQFDVAESHSYDEKKQRNQQEVYKYLQVVMKNHSWASLVSLSGVGF